jgi:hypothetical protein
MMCAIVMLLAACGSSDASRLDTSEPWDLVWFSDSGGWGVAEAWADVIEESQGVEVRVHDHSVGGLSAVTLLDMLGNESSPVRDEVAAAEIVVVYGNPEGSGATSDIGICVSTSTARRDPPQRYDLADFAPYEEVLREIYDVIFELRDGRPTIIRAIDLYSPVIADWRAAGIDEECTAAWETWLQAIREAGAEYAVPTASMFDAFNGADHDEDPREKGYIGSDGQHTLPAGQAVQAQTLHALGYDPIVP